MSKMNELIDSLTNENAEDIKQQLKSEADAKDSTNRQLYVRAKKAEGFEQDKNGNWVKKKIEKKVEKKPEAKKPEKPDELDYGQKAYLKASGINGEEEMALVKNFMDRTGDKLEAVVDDDIFQAKLKSLRDTKAANKATPKGGKAGGSTDRNSVDYYLQTGEMPPTDNPKLRREVVNARIAKEKSAESNFIPENKQQGPTFTNSGIEIK